MSLLADLADLLRQLRPDGRLLVGIDGPDAAGKTTFVRRLAELIDRPVVTASIDDWHRPRADRMARGDLSPEGYYLDSFDYPALVAGLLDPFARGAAAVRTTHFDHRADRPVHEAPRDVDHRAVLLLEGVFLLRPELRDRWDLSIYLHVPEDVTLARVVSRDRELFGETVQERYLARYLPGQALYRAQAQPMTRADLVVDNSEPDTPVVLTWRPAGRVADLSPGSRERRQGPES